MPENNALHLHLLVLRCQTGDEGAFAELYRQFNERTMRYLRGLVDEDEAHDLQQEVWLTVFKRIATLGRPAAFKTWLYQITRHRAIDFLRKKKRLTGLHESIAKENLGESADIVEISMPSPESPYLKAAMDTLSAAHRDVLILRFWEEMSYAEIALILGCSIGTVRSRIHHAKLNIKKALEQVNDLIPDLTQSHETTPKKS